MRVSLLELSRAKDAAGALLEQLGLEAYLFEVEPRDGDWLVRVECAIDEGWQTTSLAVDRGRLLTSPQDGGARAALLREWRARLVACKSASARRRTRRSPA
jgi:hypothetical protein